MKVIKNKTFLQQQVTLQERREAYLRFCSVCLIGLTRISWLASACKAPNQSFSLEARFLSSFSLHTVRQQIRATHYKIIYTQALLSNKIFWATLMQDNDETPGGSNKDETILGVLNRLVALFKTPTLGNWIILMNKLMISRILA